MLSHPLIVEAVETLFTPVCIHNNSKRPSDLAALKRFEEPAWNNPVTRVVDGEGRDLAPRNGAGWTVGAVATQMLAALEKLDQPRPEWLELLAMESTALRRGVETAVFGMT